MKVVRGTLVWSFSAHIAFGASNYLIGYMNAMLADQWVVIGVLWATGVIGVIPAAVFFWKRGTVFFRDDDDEQKPSVSANNTDKITKVKLGAATDDLDFGQQVKPGEATADVEAGVRVKPAILEKPAVKKTHQTTTEPQPLACWVKLVTISTGVFHAMGEYLMKQAFAAAPSEVGPLCAFVSSEALIVSIVSFLIWGERMSFRQSLCVVSIGLGLTVIGIGSANSGQLEEETGREKAIAFAYAFGGMFCFAAVVLGCRVGVIGGIAASSGVVARLLTEFAMGTIAVVCSADLHGLPDVQWYMWFFPLLAGLMQSFGIYCIIRALKYPNTGIANAIYSSNSVVVLILSIAVDHVFPSSLSLIGMGVVVSAVAGLSLV
eukprot:TRINITY_DN18480_c0_g1_i3.p1 TRINITY_DN18480_c0_g1~~TRINITY_DN18480_c0_g1_i3.p1  ORF type:complete len:376 (+),score=50.84 TRINITY_DN18480_c0_g1_i3:68-1195(+)